MQAKQQLHCSQAEPWKGTVNYEPFIGCLTAQHKKKRWEFRSAWYALGSKMRLHPQKH